MKPKIFIDGQEYSCDEYPDFNEKTEINEEIFKTYPKKNIRFFKFNYVGLVIVKNQMYCVLPKQFPTEEIKLSDAVLLVDVMLKYGSKSSNLMNLDFIGDPNQTTTFATQIQILESFIQNGLILRSASVTSKVSGVIHWNKTIINKIPIISDGVVLYNDMLFTKEISDENNMIHQIHLAIIYECSLAWSWFLGIDLDLNIQKFPCSRHNAIRLLENELSKSYITWEINAISSMMRYLEDEEGKDEKKEIEIYGVKTFHVIWEKIVATICNNQFTQYKKYLPQPVWISDIVKSKISHNPDIFMIEKDMLFIVDAKYYDYENSMPGWHDIVKQYFYELAFSYSLKTLPVFFTNTFNLLILPDRQYDIRYLGKYDVPKTDFGTVTAYSMSVKKSMEYYVGRSRSFGGKVRGYIVSAELKPEEINLLSR